MHSLWKKESTNNQRYVEVFKNIKPIGRQIRIPPKPNSERKASESSNKKNNERSTRYRRQADAKLDQRKWIEAMDLYNASLCYANADSANVSWAYAKRSACFLNIKMFDKCLVDIGLAKRAHCPLHLVKELEKRDEYCRKSMENNDQFKAFTPKLSYAADECYPDMANVLEMKYDSKFGRHIIAKCDISVGKTIFLEQAFIAQSPRTHVECSHCLKTHRNFIPCVNCNRGMFCDMVCAEADIFHRTECTENLLIDPVESFLMRSIFLAVSLFSDVESLIAFVEEAVKDAQIRLPVPPPLNNVQAKYRAFLQLSRFLSVENQLTVSKRSSLVYNALINRRSIQGAFGCEDKKRFLMHLVLHHDNVITSNIYSADMNENMLMNVALSYFNHACAPTAMMHRMGNLQYCVTIRPIKKNQQIFLTYVAESFVQSLFEGTLDARDYQYLWDTFGFRCGCELCAPASECDVEKRSSNIGSNEDYQFLIPFAAGLSLAHAPIDLKTKLHNTTADLLNRFGEHWCDELAIVTCAFIATGNGLFFDLFDGKFDELDESIVGKFGKFLAKILLNLQIAYIYFLAYVSGIALKFLEFVFSIQVIFRC